MLVNLKKKILYAYNFNFIPKYSDKGKLKIKYYYIFNGIKHKKADHVDFFAVRCVFCFHSGFLAYICQSLLLEY